MVETGRANSGGFQGWSARAPGQSGGQRAGGFPGALLRTSPGLRHLQAHSWGSVTRFHVTCDAIWSHGGHVAQSGHPDGGCTSVWRGRQAQGAPAGGWQPPSGRGRAWGGA